MYDFFFCIQIIFYYNCAFSKEINTFTKQQKEAKTVAFLCDKSNIVYNNIISQIKKELIELTKDKYAIEILIEEYVGWDKDFVTKKLEVLLNNDNVDIIIGIGYLTGTIISNVSVVDKPIILAYFYDFDILKLPQTNQETIIQNLTCITSSIKFLDDVITFKQLVNFKELYLVLDEKYEEYAKNVINAIDNNGINIKLIQYTDNINLIIKNLI